MITFGIILLLVLLAAVVGTLVAGTVIMARGGEANKKYSNKLMTARVALQGAALGVAVLLLLAKQS